MFAQRNSLALPTLILALLTAFALGANTATIEKDPESTVYYNVDGDITKYVTASGHTTYDDGWSPLDKSVTFPVSDAEESYKMSMSAPVTLADGTVRNGTASLSWVFTSFTSLIGLYNELTDKEDAEELGYWFSLESATSAAMISVLAEDVPFILLKDSGAFSVEYDSAAVAQLAADRALPGGMPSQDDSRFIYDFDCVHHQINAVFQNGFDRKLQARSKYFDAVEFTVAAFDITSQSDEPCGMRWHEETPWTTTPPPGPEEEPIDAELYPSTEA